MGLNEKFFKSAETGGGSGLFNTVLYTGSGSSGTNEITGAGFEPDLIWIKRRPFFSAGNPGMVDSLRGNQILFTNLTLAQLAPSNATISMTNDGFDISTYGASWANQNNISYVAWCFKAGGAAVSNTDGDITSQVSANVANGFSIVKWSGDGSDMDIGHGLDAAPEMVIKKNFISSVDWMVDISVIDGSWDYLKLNTTVSKTNHTYVQSPTSTIFNTMGANYNSSGMIAYCFHSVAGVSKVGGYTGGSGATVNTGFEPSWVMIKRTNSTSDWFIYDNVRGEDKYLLANTNGAENTLDNVDFTATGFNLKASNASLNVTGGIYIYYAIA